MSVRRKTARADNVQSELDDLQRKYRLMEVSRKSYSEDSQNTLRMQRQQVEKLKKENDRLKEDLALETRQARHANNLSASAQIAKLQDQGDMYARKIGNEKRRIEELDRQIKEMETTILEQRKEMGGVNASRDNNEQVQKQIRRLENRLDKALVKFNEALAHNKSLRATIDNLRRERSVFDGIYKKLERELQEKKTKMAEIIEISNAAYQARDEAQAQMVQLKAQADREQAEFEDKWNQLGNLVAKDQRMRAFLQLKEGAGKDAAGGAGAGAGADGGAAGSADPAVEEESKLRRRVEKGAVAIKKDRASIHQSMERVREYEEAFARIQSATRISDIDTLVSTFVQAEDHNFALFNHLNDLSSEMERLDESIGEIKAELEKYSGEGSAQDSRRKVIMADLEDQLAKTEAKAAQYEKRHQEAVATVQALKSGIASVYERLGCSNDMLGSAGVTESNLLSYLGAIEERTNELLRTYREQQESAGEGSGTGATQDVAITPPTVGDQDGTGVDGDEDEEEPISVEEMARLTQQAHESKAAAAADADAPVEGAPAGEGAAEPAAAE